jgi:hypothetical protein
MHKSPAAAPWLNKMLSKIFVVLAVTSLAALGLKLMQAAASETALEQEVAGQLNALREHLFNR